jgi:uncharacterized protein (TIGR02646 family)
MILIKKDSEPREWKEYRNTPGVDYQSIPELVDSLLEEQGYICAYCMRRIPCKDRLYKRDGKTFVFTNEDHRIEHMLSRENHDDKKLDYSNMVICCPGHIGNEDHCDRLKENRDISFSPLDCNFIATLSYKIDGSIVSSNESYNKEINEVLNLNTPILKESRKNAWEAVKKELIAQKGEKPWNKSILFKYINKYSSKTRKDGKLKLIQYCGVVLYFLQKKLKQMT